MVGGKVSPDVIEGRLEFAGGWVDSSGGSLDFKGGWLDGGGGSLEYKGGRVKFEGGWLDSIGGSLEFKGGWLELEGRWLNGGVDWLEVIGGWPEFEAGLLDVEGGGSFSLVIRTLGFLTVVILGGSEELEGGSNTTGKRSLEMSSTSLRVRRLKLNTASHKALHHTQSLINHMSHEICIARDN